MRTNGFCIAVVSPVLEVVSNVEDKSVSLTTTADLILNLAVTSDFRREERHLGVIAGMGPYS